MTTTRTQRTGHTMLAVLYYVDLYPGCTQQSAANYAGPNGSHYWGSRSVQRCLRAGLIEDRSQRKGTYALHLTPAGHDALAGA